MLQKLRDNAHGWWVYVVIPVLILLFAFWGIGNYLGGSMSQNAIAKVNGVTISYTAFANVFQRLNQSENPNNDKATAGAIKLQVLETLVNQEIFYQALLSLGFSVSQTTIDGLIAATPAFQDQGKFSMNKYNTLLNNLGISTEALRQSLSESYVIQQFQGALFSSNFAMIGEVNQETTLANLVRDVNYISINPQFFMPGIKINDALVSQYYQAHKSQFMSPYQVKLQYLILSLDQFSKQYKDPNTAKAAFNNAVINLSDTSFQNPTSLDVSAHALQQAIQSTDWLSTQAKTGLFANPGVVAAVMSDSVLNQGNNSGVINLGPNQVMVLRVSDKQAPTQLSLNQVAAELKAGLVMQQAGGEAADLSRRIQASLASGQSMQQVAVTYHLPMQTLVGVGPASKNLDPQLVAAFIRASLKQSSSVISGGNMVIFQVNKIYLPRELAVQIPAAEISGLWTQIEVSSVLNALQTTAKVKLNDKLLKAAT